MDQALHHRIYQFINKFCHVEFNGLQLQDIKNVATFMSIPAQGKRKDVLIEEICKVLYQVILRSNNMFNGFNSGFPSANYDINYLASNPHVRRVIEKYNEAVQNPAALYNASQPILHNYPQQTFLNNHYNLLQLAQESLPRHGPAMQHLQADKSNAKKCICGMAAQTETDSSTVICVRQGCDRRCHYQCVKIKAGSDETRVYECFDCVLKNFDPLHEVIETLKFPSKLDNSKLDFLIEHNMCKAMELNQNIGMEIRCLRLEEKVIEQTWPHQGELYIDNRRELEFKPLQANSSLKKRKDEKLFTRNVREGINSVLIKYHPHGNHRDKNATETYVAGVYLVKKLPPEELVQKITQNNKRSAAECKRRVTEQFKSDGLEIDKLSYSLTCVLDMQPLKTPAKGIFCKHVNCFSLENHISVTYRNNQRKWLCPICRTKAHELIVDAYFQEILQEAHELNVFATEFPEVTFHSSGDYTFSGKEKEMKKRAKENKIKNESACALAPELSKGKSETAKAAKKQAAVTIVLDSDEEQEDAASSHKQTQQKQSNTEFDKAQPQQHSATEPKNGVEEQILDVVPEPIVLSHRIGPTDPSRPSQTDAKILDRQDIGTGAIVGSTTNKSIDKDSVILQNSDLGPVAGATQNREASELISDNKPLPQKLMAERAPNKLNQRELEELIKNSNAAPYKSVLVDTLNSAAHHPPRTENSPDIQNNFEIIELEQSQIQTERESLSRKPTKLYQDMDTLLTDTHKNIRELLKYSEKDGELRSYSQFVKNETRTITKSKAYPISRNKKFLRLLPRCFPDELKLPRNHNPDAVTKKKQTSKDIAIANGQEIFTSDRVEPKSMQKKVKSEKPPTKEPETLTESSTKDFDTRNSAGKDVSSSNIPLPRYQVTDTHNQDALDIAAGNGEFKYKGNAHSDPICLD